ncbi:MAG: transposase [Chloroflexi bacterium]|nr:transposase [Chloroflexota bacterium]
MLEGFDPNQIQDDEGARRAIVMLLNLVEELKSENQKLREQNQRLRDEINRLKGEQGKPNIKANKKKNGSSSTDYSSEKERHRPKKRRKQSKKEKIEIDREQVLRVDPETLPEDAKFKGYEDVVVQDIKIETDNVLFRKEKYHSASQHKVYIANLPVGYEGQFGPGIKSWIVVMYFAMNVTEPKIITFLETVGIYISTGQISEILHGEVGGLHTEKEEIYKAGLRSTPWQQIDDTATRVNGQNQYTHVVCNPFYTAYFTKPHKDRLTVLQVLWGDRPLMFCLNDLAYAYLESYSFSKVKRNKLAQLPREQMFIRAEFEALLEERLPELGVRQFKQVLEAAAIAAYHTQDEFPIVDLLLADDAGQFKQIVESLALCWIHDGRHYKKLMPSIEYHRRLLDEFLTKFWSFYHELHAYRLNPTKDERERLDTEFDELFSTVTNYHDLDDRIAKTKAKKVELLQVLEHPEIPLHNNDSELGARKQKPKLNISFGPRTDAGVKIWDTGLTIVATARKLGVNVLDYFRDRISRVNQMPSLSSLIEQRAADSHLDLSWQNEPP